MLSTVHGRRGKNWHRLVLRPADTPAQLDLARFAGLRVEGPFQHPAPVAQIARGRRRGDGKDVDLDVLGLADRDLIFDRDLDRRIVAVANGDLELALVGLGGAR